MSLRDQLLKAGLVSKKQAQKVEASNRKQGHDSKKNKELADALQAEKQLELDKIEEEKNKIADELANIGIEKKHAVTEKIKNLIPSFNSL